MLTLDLNDEVTPFTEEEICKAVRETPNDRASGLDGFNGCFYQTA